MDWDLYELYVNLKFLHHLYQHIQIDRLSYNLLIHQVFQDMLSEFNN